MLALSTLFPSIERPGFGRFVARQFDAVARTGGVDLTVVCPVPRQSAHGEARDYPVHYVRFASLPVIGARWNPGSIARAILPLVLR